MKLVSCGAAWKYFQTPDSSTLIQRALEPAGIQRVEIDKPCAQFGNVVDGEIIIKTVMVRIDVWWELAMKINRQIHEVDKFTIHSHITFLSSSRRPT